MPLPLSTGQIFSVHALYIVHTCTYIPKICMSDIGHTMVYVPNLEGIFVSGTYLAITYEVAVVLGCVMAYIYAKCWVYNPM